MKTRRLIASVWPLFIFLILPGIAFAEGALTVKGIGPRAGMGINPDQFVFGAQAVMGRMLKIANLASSIDVGFGNNVTDVTFNADLQLTLLRPPKSTTSFYGFAGPTIAYFDPDKGDSDTEIGLSVGGGLKIPMGTSNLYNLEARIGIGDVPDFKLLLGIYFGGAPKKEKS
ncbi:MAG: hypothetical protein AB1746_06955 [Candidatus Zixiibacteriota bacterium]